MELRDIAGMRLANQWLAAAPAVAPETVVARFGAMQAQEFALARWSIGQRSAGLDDAAVQRAFDEGRILRLHTLRPTWHFVAAADLRWIQALTAPRVRGMNRYYDGQHGLDEVIVGRAIDLVGASLQGYRHLTRAELGRLLAEAGLPGEGGPLAYVMMRAELDGVVTSGPLRGRQHTYALVEERAPRQTELHGDEALVELTRRFFVSHGPVTLTDFAWWSSLTLTRIRHGIALLGDALSCVEVDGLRYWSAPESTVDGIGPAAHVVQAYDEYTNAYRDSRVVFTVGPQPYTVARDRMTIHGIVVDGAVVGLWRREVGPAGVTARVKRLRPFSARDRREIEAAFARYAAFAGVGAIQLHGDI